MVRKLLLTWQQYDQCTKTYESWVSIIQFLRQITTSNWCKAPLTKHKGQNHHFDLSKKLFSEAYLANVSRVVFPCRMAKFIKMGYTNLVTFMWDTYNKEASITLRFMMALLYKCLRRGSCGRLRSRAPSCRCAWPSAGSGTGCDGHRRLWWWPATNCEKRDKRLKVTKSPSANCNSIN